MLIDARSVAPDTQIGAQVCVVGAGAAGITIARELGSAGINVCLLESGGLELDRKTQELYEGQSVGRPYYDLNATRLRYFGGTTNHWTGVCRPLDPRVFRPRGWIANGTGWPIDYEELLPFYEAAHPICQLGPFQYEEFDSSLDETTPLPLDGGEVQQALLQRSPPTRFGEVYRKELRDSSTVAVYLHGNAAGVEVTDRGGRVTGLLVRTLSGNQFEVRADAYVLATGAIENARLLLDWSLPAESRLGVTGSGLGRYFMDHVTCPVAVLIPSGSARDLRFFDWRDVDGTLIRGVLVPTGKALRSRSMLNVHATLVRSSLRSDLRAVASGLVEARVALKSGNLLDDLGPHLARIIADTDDVALHTYDQLFRRQGDRDAHLVAVHVEPEPRRANSLTLADERDALGMPRVRLDWRLSGAERRTAENFVELLGRAVGASGLGRLRSLLDRSGEWWEQHARGAWHQMGTTRMSRDPEEGVVDPDCRVHGVGNVYVAGSSVFPNPGHATPTLTIVALSLRLARHLSERLNG